MATLKEIHSSIPTSSAVWLIAAHILMCLSQLISNLSHYPVGHSLYYWWIGPMDFLALAGGTLLYLIAPRWGFCLTGLVSGVEALALIYLGLKNLQAPQGILALCGAMTVIARIPTGWVIAAIRNPRKPLLRGCTG